MSNLLVKLFIKNYDNTGDVVVRTAYGVLASIVGIVCNVMLFVVKIIVGFLLGSISVIADSFNNLSDAASSIIGFVGVKMAEKPADKEHPFGHGRIEYISAFIVAFLVIQVGFSFFKGSVEKIVEPQTITFNSVSVIILAVSVLFKLWLGFFNRSLGKQVDSKVMKATATDSFSDAAITLLTIISILVAAVWEVNVDGFVGIGLSLLVIWNGINIAKDTLAPLIGESANPELYEQLKSKVESYDGIVGTHDLIVHDYGPGRSMASIHAEVPADVNALVSHEIIDRIEEEVLSEMKVFLVIHMDPVETNNENVKKYKRMIGDIVKSIDEEMEVHDFRIVEGNIQTNLIFDLVVPFSYKVNEDEKIRKAISDIVSSRDEHLKCVIKIERGYM